MARTNTEVLIGPGTLYVADVGTAFPVDPSVAPAGAWADIGYSEEGWAFNVDRTVEEIEVAEELDPIDLQQTKRDIHVVGAAAQASIDNFKTAMGGGTIVTAVGPPATKTYTPPATGVLDRKALLLRVLAPNGKTRDVQIPKVVSVSAINMEHKKAPAKSLLAIDFKIVKDAGVAPFTQIDLT